LVSIWDGFKISPFEILLDFFDVLSFGPGRRSEAMVV